MKTLLSAVAFTASVLAGCSGLKAYSNTPARNLDVHTRTDSGSFLSSTRTSLDIFSVNNTCQTSYQGTVTLDKDTRTIGLPAERPSYLVFRFESSSFLTNSSGATSYDTLLTPLPDRHYDVDVRYIDGIYSVTILERSSGDRKANRIAPVELKDC
jgi:hypothetical protein